MPTSQPDRFVRLPTELLEALLRARFNGTQWGIVCWVIRHALGWNRNTTPFTWYRIANDLGMDRGGVVRAGNRLLLAAVLNIEANQIGIQPDHRQWIRSKLAPRRENPMTGVCADKRQRQPLTGIIASNDGNHRQGCQESSVLRRSKDRYKDNLKTYKDRPARKSDGATHRDPATPSIQRRHLAGAAKPVPGKYDGLSQN